MSAAMPVIKFYKTHQPYDCFSNVTVSYLSMLINGKVYNVSSSEAIFQSVRGITSANPKIRADAEALITEPPGAGLQKKGHDLPRDLYDKRLSTSAPGSPYTKEQVKEFVMEDILLVKATQNLELCRTLLATGDLNIIENTALKTQGYDDIFWGNGRAGNGRNALGNIWMRVRTILRNELASTGTIRRRIGFSETTANLLGHAHYQQYDDPKLGFIGFTKAQIESPGQIFTTADGIFQAQQRQGMSHPGGAAAGSPGSSAAGAYQPAPGSSAFADTAIGRVLKATGAHKLDFAKNKKLRGEHVLKLRFPDDVSAQAFAKKHGSPKRGYPKVSGATVIVGPNRAAVIFKKLNVSVQGRQAQVPMWNALWNQTHAKAPNPFASAPAISPAPIGLGDVKQQQDIMAAKAGAVPASSAAAFGPSSAAAFGPSSAAALPAFSAAASSFVSAAPIDAINKLKNKIMELVKTTRENIQIGFGEDIDQKEALFVKFQNETQANEFAKLGIGLTSQDTGAFPFVTNGKFVTIPKYDAAFLFKKLGIERHGAKGQFALWDSLKYEYNQILKSQGYRPKP